MKTLLTLIRVKYNIELRDFLTNAHLRSCKFFIL